MSDTVTMADLYPVLPEVCLALMAMALLMFGVFRGDKSTSSCSWLAVLALLLTGIVMALLPEEADLAFGGQFVVDQFVALVVFKALLRRYVALFALAPTS